MKIYVEDIPIEDEQDAGGLWDLSAELAKAVAFYRQADDENDPVVYANEWGQEDVYHILCGEVKPITDHDREKDAEIVRLKEKIQLCFAKETELSALLLEQKTAFIVEKQAREIAERALYISLYFADKSFNEHIDDMVLNSLPDISIEEAIEQIKQVAAKELQEEREGK